MRCCVRSADSRLINSRKVLLRVSVLVQADGYEPQTQSVSVLKDPPACLQLKTQTYETNAPVELSERAFQVSEELNLPDGRPQIARLVSCLLTPVVQEQGLVGSKGVHYCAACDGAPYRGRTVAVVGGGNSAAADALALSRIAKKVYLIHRRDSLRATKVYHEPLMSAPNVEFCWNSTVSALLHESRLTGLRLKDVNTGAERELACDGLFVSVGRAPATELFWDELALDKSGYIIADESTRTNLPGVFAVGDVRTKALRQVVTAVSDGAVAVHYAEEYLAENR